MTSPRPAGATQHAPIASLQAGRALAALAVLLFHTNITLGLPKYLSRDIVPFFNAGDAGVHFFFVLSGFIICFIHFGDVGRPGALAPFVLKRLRRLLPALWATLLLVLGLRWLWPGLAAGAVTAWDVASAFLLLPADSEVLLSVEWTLRHEMLFYVIFAVIIAAPRAGIALFAAWLALSATLPWLAQAFPLNFLFSTYHVLFGLGALAALAYRGRWLRWPAAVTAIGAALFVAGWTFKLQAVNADVVTLVLGLGAMLLISGTVELERDGRLRVHRSLTFLGDASYAIYLVHFFAVSALCRLVAALAARIAIPDLLAFAAVATGALLFGIAFHVVVEKPLLAALALRRVQALPT